MILKTDGRDLKADKKLRIWNTSEPVKVKIELDKDWKYYDDYALILKYYGYSEKVLLSKELDCEIPSELLSMEIPSYLYDKDHKRTIYAQLVGIIYSASGEYAINLKRSRIESIITIETAHKK